MKTGTVFDPAQKDAYARIAPTRRDGHEKNISFKTASALNQIAIAAKPRLDELRRALLSAQATGPQRTLVCPSRAATTRLGAHGNRGMTTAPEVPSGHGYVGPPFPRTASDDPQRSAFIDRIKTARSASFGSDPTQNQRAPGGSDGSREYTTFAHGCDILKASAME